MAANFRVYLKNLVQSGTAKIEQMDIINVSKME